MAFSHYDHHPDQVRQVPDKNIEMFLGLICKVIYRYQQGG